MAPWLMVCVGSIRVASPEWTPASSTCSEMAWEITWPREDFKKSCQKPTSMHLLPPCPISPSLPPTPSPPPVHSNRCLEHWPVPLRSPWWEDRIKPCMWPSPPPYAVTDCPRGQLTVAELTSLFHWLEWVRSGEEDNWIDPCWLKNKKETKAFGRHWSDLYLFLPG